MLSLKASIGRALSLVALGKPDAPTVTEGDATLTYQQLDRESNRLARVLQSCGVVRNDLVTIALPNGIDFIVAGFAIWKAGGTPQPVSHRLPFRERAEIIELAQAKVIFGVPEGSHDGIRCLPIGFQADASVPDDPLPEDLRADCYKAPTSGGSTGRPKLIMSGAPAEKDVWLMEAPAHWVVMSATIQSLSSDTPGDRNDGVDIITGPLYHNAPFMHAFEGVLMGSHQVLMRRFDAGEWLRLVERCRATFSYMVPTMMKRVWDLPEATRHQHDLSSLKAVFHMAAPCPPWLKEAWCHWLGPEKIYELYGATEGQLVTVIRGDAWLAKPKFPGSNLVGKPLGTTSEMSIRDESGRPVPPLTMGEVWTRSTVQTYAYRGAKSDVSADGFETVGDIGMVDEEGYLYLGDRKKDMVIVGGSNVYPAEVEAALEEHPAVGSCAVVGVPEGDLGHRLHAVIYCPQEAGSPSDEQLKAFLGERLVPYKIPRSFERAREHVRDDAGKVRRSALAQDRASKL